MRRRIATFLSTTLAAGMLLALTTAQPASAVWTCAGQGVMTTSPTYYPPFTDSLTVGNSQKTFALRFLVGGCAHVPSGSTGKTLSATGIFSGWCGFASGLGITANGELFAWVWDGTTLTFTGHVVGKIDIVPDVLNGESCSPTGTGALNFIVTGAVTLLNCGVLGPDFDSLLPMDMYHVWVNGSCTPGPL